MDYLVVTSLEERRVNIASDTFATQLGYGSQLESALRKTYTHAYDINGDASDKISNWNIIIWQRINFIHCHTNHW